MLISYPTLCCWLLYIQWRQCECNFGGDEECIKEQLQGIRESPVFIGRQRWPYRERRESLRSLCKYSGTRSKRKFTRKNDNCGYWIRFFLSLFASMEAPHRVHAAKEVICHAVSMRQQKRDKLWLFTKRAKASLAANHLRSNEGRR